MLCFWAIFSTISKVIKFELEYPVLLCLNYQIRLPNSNMSRDSSLQRDLLKY